MSPASKGRILFWVGVGEKLGQPKSTSGFSLPRAFLCTTPFLEIWDNHFCPWESVGCALGGFGFKILGFDPAQKKKKNPAYLLSISNETLPEAAASPVFPSRFVLCKVRRRIQACCYETTPHSSGLFWESWNWQLSLSLSAASSFKRPEAVCAGAYECAFQGLKIQITRSVLVPWGSLVKLQPEVLSMWGPCGRTNIKIVSSGCSHSLPSRRICAGLRLSVHQESVFTSSAFS